MSVHHIRIPELVVPGKPLGRHIHIDDRSAAYPAELAPQLVSIRHQSAGLPINQADTSSCTGNALVGALNCVPHWRPGQPALTELDALAVYSDEEQLLGFGPYPANDNGGSGLAVCQAARARGWIFRYEHASDAQSALHALVPRPVITGINWFTSFDDCDPVTGIIEIASTATVRGGHEIVLDEIDVLNELVWGWQSWPLPWGLNGTGRFGMRFSTWDALLQQGGDVTVPRTTKGWVAQPITN